MKQSLEGQAEVASTLNNLFSGVEKWERFKEAGISIRNHLLVIGADENSDILLRIFGKNKTGFWDKSDIFKVRALTENEFSQALLRLPGLVHRERMHKRDGEIFLSDFFYSEKFAEAATALVGSAFLDNVIAEHQGLTQEGRFSNVWLGLQSDPLYRKEVVYDENNGETRTYYNNNDGTLVASYYINGLYSHVIKTGAV